ncbi:hypothetical protein [Ruminococcus sp.]|uniref:hypothetical protein n=1 Tax=Ruminococcus sp. TaxID=41978 RepID=UPI0025EACF8D|nr:hypothetical protein [Ruminococcus sp.]MBR1430686.1 hypothetical protein [Ruminococcus sp.]
MKKHYNYFCSLFISSVFVIFSAFFSATVAFAAEDKKSESFSKGTTALIMIAVFIAAAICSAFITFKVKKNKISRSDETSSDNEKDK